jgi:hypothetical protein
MSDFERLGVFYLGRRYDVPSRSVTTELVLYDSRDLVTHALCVGMTGSGKTGLGIALVEEAAIDGVPVIVIDPKGDLTNLLLTFPGLTAGEFEPWVRAEEAERAATTRAAFAAGEAARWARGLAEWGQDGARIQRLRAAAEFTVYTPGSTTGRPVSVLASFERPRTDDAEIRRERVQTDVSSLLALAGIPAEPLRSREHLLLSAILTAAWDARQNPTLEEIVHRVQSPPMSSVGAIAVDSFFPPKDRFELAMAINTLLASPAFAAWTAGDPLDATAFLRTADGRPRVSVFSIAHLDDAQRMFFVSLLLGALSGWMRAQAGTASLRAMLYMDEIVGFFPPVANPPSKPPLLTLLKQGRAAGLGVVLATQNPVDLDYKALGNIGTWWLGRLQTERDKARVLDGLESAGAGGFSRGEVDRLLSALTSRVFIMRNVHDEGLTVFHSRWALSYLRGPLSREEIRRLTHTAADQPAAPPLAAPAVPHPAPIPPGPPLAVSQRPVLAPGVPEYFGPGRGIAPTGPLRPVLYGAADVRFLDRSLRLDARRTVVRIVSVGSGPVPVDWQHSRAIELMPGDLDTEAPAGASFEPVPAAAAQARSYRDWAARFAASITGSETMEVLKSPATGEISHEGETEREFRGRLQQSAREQRDRALDALRRKYASKIASLEDRVRRARHSVERESAQASGQHLQTAISVGATLLGAFLGRRAVSATTLGRATTAARGVGRASKERQDVARARETLAALEAQRRELEDQLAAEAAALERTLDAATGPLERVVVPAKRANVQVKTVALVWLDPGWLTDVP